MDINETDSGNRRFTWELPNLNRLAGCDVTFSAVNMYVRKSIYVNISYSMHMIQISSSHGVIYKVEIICFRGNDQNVNRR